MKKLKVYQKNIKRILPVKSIYYTLEGEIESISVYNCGCNGEYNVSPKVSTYYKNDDVYNLGLLEFVE